MEFESIYHLYLKIKPKGYGFIRNKFKTVNIQIYNNYRLMEYYGIIKHTN